MCTTRIEWKRKSSALLHRRQCWSIVTRLLVSFCLFTSIWSRGNNDWVPTNKQQLEPSQSSIHARQLSGSSITKYLKTTERLIQSFTLSKCAGSTRKSSRNDTAYSFNMTTFIPMWLIWRKCLVELGWEVLLRPP